MPCRSQCPGISGPEWRPVPAGDGHSGTLALKFLNRLSSSDPVLLNLLMLMVVTSSVPVISTPPKSQFQAYLPSLAFLAHCLDPVPPVILWFHLYFQSTDPPTIIVTLVPGPMSSLTSLSSLNYRINFYNHSLGHPFILSPSWTPRCISFRHSHWLKLQSRGSLTLHLLRGRTCTRKSTK